MVLRASTNILWQHIRFTSIPLFSWRGNLCHGHLEFWCRSGIAPPPHFAGDVDLPTGDTCSGLYGKLCAPKNFVFYFIQYHIHAVTSTPLLPQKQHSQWLEGTCSHVPSRVLPTRCALRGFSVPSPVVGQQCWMSQVTNCGRLSP